MKEIRIDNVGRAGMEISNIQAIQLTVLTSIDLNRIVYPEARFSPIDKTELVSCMNNFNQIHIDLGRLHIDNEDLVRYDGDLYFKISEEDAEAIFNFKVFDVYDYTDGSMQMLCADERQSFLDFDYHIKVGVDLREQARLRQLNLQYEIQKKGYNIVTCHTCETVLIHTKEEGDEATICNGCGNVVYFNDCSDLYY